MKRLLGTAALAAAVAVFSMPLSSAAAFSDIAIITAPEAPAQQQEVIQEALQPRLPAITQEDKVQIDCMAENMYYEARGEGRIGQIAVGNVVMNRVASPRFPKTACAVIKQRRGNVCQFSWVCSPRRAPNSSELARIRVLAEDVYFGRVQDYSRGALFFHANYVRPKWSKTSGTRLQIGNHVFYRG